MASNFPTAAVGAKTDYDSDDPIASADPNALSEDVNALGAKLGHGTDDNAPATNKILRGTATGKSEWDFDIKDEDAMTSNSATALPTQQSVKAYIDSGTVTMTNKTLTSPAVTGLTGSLSSPVLTTPQIEDTSANHQYIFGVSELSADRTVTLPLLTGNDEFVFKAHTQVFTNKTIVQKVVSYTPDAAGTATLDVSTGGIHKITMPAGNITIAISNEATGQCFAIEITQDGTGSRTVTWFTTIKWAGGVAPTLTTTASKRDTFGFRVTGTDTYDAFIVGQNV